MSPSSFSSSFTGAGELRTLARRIAVVGIVVVDLLLVGALGLSISEGVGFWYAFRWALDTAATVGGFPQPHTVAGQVIQVCLILVGVGTLFYALATVAEFFVAGHLGELLAARRNQKMIDSLSDHHIICGFGRVGRQVARDLQARARRLRGRRRRRREPPPGAGAGHALRRGRRDRRTTC